MRARVVELSGKTVDEAVARALEQLGLNRDQVDVDVIREGKRGVLGIGAEEAIVRVSAKPSATAQLGAQQRPPRQRPPRRDGEDRPRSRGPERSEGPDRGPGAFGARPRPSGQRRNGSDREPRPEPTPGEPVLVPGAPAALPTAPPAEAEDPVDFAGRTLRDLLTLLGLTETEIAARDPETPGDGVGLVTQVFEIYGTDQGSRDLGLLIGRRGETLSSLQYLVNVITASRYGNHQVFSVDVDQYRRRREQTLVDMARRIAAEVRDTGDVITLEPMPAAERRIIHITLAEEPGVKTESVGHGEHRQVEVLPADTASDAGTEPQQPADDEP